MGNASGLSALERLLRRDRTVTLISLLAASLPNNNLMMYRQRLNGL
jgi:hypothetical protein